LRKNIGYCWITGATCAPNTLQHQKGNAKSACEAIAAPYSNAYDVTVEIVATMGQQSLQQIACRLSAD
jgi:hypothetical protein